MKRLLLLITFILSVLYTSGQTVYPIRTYTVLNPPLPYTLSGFASEPGRMQLNVLVDDVSLDQYAVKFRITIQGNGIKLYTKPDLRQQPFFLDGGLTETVTGLDLEPLFNPDNLIFEGYSRNEYKRNGRLPEGVYRVWVDILDYYRSFQVSQSIPGIAMIYLTRAPRLSFPMSGSEIDPRTEPNLRFSWMGTLPADPLADIAYRFRLWEIRPQGRDPYEVARAMQPIFTEETTDPNFIYDMGLPPLIDGMNYAWQVEAFDREGRARFQNDGTSEVYQFRYGRSCITPEPVITSVAHTEVALRWQGDLSAQLYRISYKGSQETEWQHLETASITHTLKQLDDNTGYEIKVQAICGDQEGDYSRIIRCKTNRIVDYTCGATGDQFDLSNREPLAALGRFDEFKAADFVIEVEEAEGANGLFSGKGLALVPYLGFAKFMVSFENVFINSDGRMVDGQIEFIYDEASGMVLGFGDGGSDDGEETVDIVEEIEKVTDKVITTDGEVTDVTVSDNTVILTKKDGTTEIIKIEEGDKVAIVSTDGSGGAVHVVDQSSGRVYTTPKKKAGGKKGSGSVGTAATTGQYGCVVDFKAPPTMRFGYDPVGDGKSKPDAYFNRNKSGDLISWKSIQSGATDFIDVVIKGDCPPDSLRYLRESGLITPSTPQDKGSRLMLTGLADGEEDILTVAIAKTEHINDSTTREILTEAGALGLVAYDAIGKDVVLVPVNKAQCPEKPLDIKIALDQLYGPAVTSWQVMIRENLQVDDLSPEGFKTSGNNFAARYTKDMKAVIKELKQQDDYNRKTLYLFFVNAPNADRAGYMPLAGDYGFIFNFGSNTNVIGHELAHGTFNLRHTFSDQAQHFLPEKSTKNLMDYANGTELWKYQWDLIHNPETVLFDAFDEEEGASHDVDMNELIAWVKNNHGTITDFDQSEFHNFNVWGDKAFKVKANGQEIYVFAEVFEDGIVNLKETNVNFEITNKFHSGFHLTFKYGDKDEEAINLWTYSYEYFKNLYAELGYTLTQEEEKTIIDNYKKGLNENKEYCNKIDVFLETIPDFVLKQISFQDRIDYLKVLSKCSLFDGELYWGSMDTNEEEAVLNILKSFVLHDEIDALLEVLKAKVYPEDEDILLAKLYYGMDDARGDEFTKFIQEISRLATSSPKYVKEFKAKESNPEFEKVVYIGKRPWVDFSIVGGERKYDSFEFDKKTGSVSYVQEIRRITGSVPVSFNTSPYYFNSPTINFPTWEWISDPKVTYNDPFELILVDDLTKFDRAMEKLLEKGQHQTTGGYLIPAISLQYARTKHRNENIEQGIYVALDVAAVASGVGALSIGAKTLSLARKGYLAFDVINGMANIAVNSTDLYLNEDVQEYVTYYNLITAGLNIKQLYDEGAGLMRNADGVVKAGDDFVEGIVNGVRRYNVGGEIADGATTITRQLSNNGNTITLKWTVNAKGKIEFGNRSNLAIILGTVEDEAHHLLTWTKSGSHSVVQAAAKDGFHLNTFENGIGLSKYRKSLNEGMHGNHPAYDDYVVHRLTQYKQLNSRPTPQQANEFIQNTLIPEMRQIIDQADQSVYNLNEYFKQVINPNIGTLLKE